jgi:hypothetical protein
MKKIFKATAVVGVVALSWATGAVVYLMSATSYFRNREKHEEESGNINIGASGSSRRIVSSNPGRKIERTGTSAPRPIRTPHPDELKQQPNAGRNSWRV